MRTVADGGLVLLRLDVDDDVAAGQRVVQSVLDAVGRGVTLADGRAGRNRDDDVGELPRTGLAHAQSPECDRGLDPRDRRARRLFGAGRNAVHQHVDVALHQPRRCEQDERGDEERRGRVRARIAGAHEQQPKQHGPGAGEIAGEVQRVRGQGGAAIALRRPPRDDRAAEVDDDHDADNCERVPGCLHRGAAAADEVRDRTPRDEAAGGEQDRPLGERAEMLGLAVAVLVRDVGRPHRHADGEERQQRRDQVGARMRGLRDEAEAVRGQARAELEHDQRDGRADRDERRSPLGIHAASETERAAEAARSSDCSQNR